MNGHQRLAGLAIDLIHEVEQRDGIASGAVEDAAGGLGLGRFGGEEIGMHHIVDGDEVAALQPIAEDGGRLATQHGSAESGDDAGVSRGEVLPRSEDIEVAQ